MGTSGVGRLETALLVSSGGFLGSTARYGVGFAVPGPPGTLLVNALGCFFLGTLLYVADVSDLIADRVRVVLATGVLSSFTTYSTFAVEAFRADPPTMAATIFLTYATGLGAVLVGRQVANWTVTLTGGRQV